MCVFAVISYSKFNYNLISANTYLAPDMHQELHSEPPKSRGKRFLCLFTHGFQHLEHNPILHRFGESRVSKPQQRAQTNFKNLICKTVKVHQWAKERPHPVHSKFFLLAFCFL